MIFEEFDRSEFDGFEGRRAFDTCQGFFVYFDSKIYFYLILYFFKAQFNF
jgi:hypothetical protein